MVGFYKDFAKLLYEKTEIPVWCLSHAGHNFADKSTVTMPSFQENQHLYGLEGQVKHKVKKTLFIDFYYLKRKYSNFR